MNGMAHKGSHVLLIHQAFAAIGEPGGTRHHELARYLVAQGYRVTIIASPISYLTGNAKIESPSNSDTLDQGITILRAYTYAALHKSFFHRVLSFLSFMLSSFWLALRVPDVDLVWGTSPPIFQGITAWSVSRLKRVPFLFEVRDLWPAFAIQVGVLHNPFLIKASEWLERFLYHHADGMIVNSPGYVNHVRERGARKVTLIPNGADPRMFDPGDRGLPFREQCHFEEKFVALYAGAHGISNDLNTLLHAAAMLSDRPQIAIVLLGDGKEKNNLIARANEMGLNNVHFLAPIPKSDMPMALAAADTCIAILKAIPLYATTYPNKVFDYMAAGRPVVLAIDGVIRDVVETAQAGIYVQPGDADALAEAITRLCNDSDLTHRMGAAGRKAIEEQFDRALVAERLKNLFEEMISDKSG